VRTQSQTLDDVTSTSNASYEAKDGPEVTITVGATGRLLVFVSAQVSSQSSQAANNSVYPHGRMGVALSGANTRSATESESLSAQANLTLNLAATLGVGISGTRVVLIEDLTPGPTTVTAMYRMQGNATQANFQNRNITAMAI
jgi:hypothetical protein